MLHLAEWRARYEYKYLVNVILTNQVTLLFRLTLHPTAYARTSSPLGFCPFLSFANNETTASDASC